MTTRTLLDRLAGKFTVGDGCWEWTASVDNTGYGRIGAGGRHGRPLVAHRVVYELLAGPIPEGLTLDHLCRNRRCVRPDHLEPCGRGENVRRGARTITVCPRGHAYDEANTYINRRGHRRCRRCHADQQRARRYRGG